MKATRQMVRQQESRIDYGIILSVLILAIIGIVSVYATTHLIQGQDLRPTLMHALWYGVGALVIIFTIQLDSEQYWKIARLLYGFGILLLILVLLFHDRQLALETGAKSWFRVGNVSFQPSEVFKPAYTVFLARLVSEHNASNLHRSLRSDFILLGKIALCALPPMVLIQIQNDLGTNLVIISITAGIILISGISWKILLPIILIAVIGGGSLIILAGFYPHILVDSGLFDTYQMARIQNWLNPFGDTQGSGYQLAQSIKAVGSGQLSGKGFGFSEVSVPVRESDFIFTTIAENFGFLGASVLLFVYFVLIYQMVQTCFETKNEFYAYISTGIISMILFHIFENIGMTIGLLPITGIPLPFVSQGGTALLSNMIGVGLILSMRYHHRNYKFALTEDYF